MQVRVKAREAFIHGPFNLDRGAEVLMDASMARDLGDLVEVVGDAATGTKAAKPTYENKMAAAPSDDKATQHQEPHKASAPPYPAPERVDATADHTAAAKKTTAAKKTAAKRS